MNGAPSSQADTSATRRELRVVVVEDNGQDAEIIVCELRSAGFDIEWTRVETEPQYLAALATAPDLIISDYNLPQFDGLRAVDLLVERGLEIPFILVSGTIGEEQAVLAIQRGAEDYLLKDRLNRLGPAVRRALEMRQTRQEHKFAVEGLRRSEHDYRQLVDTLPVAVYSTDTTGRVTLFNEAAATLWGTLPDPLDIYNNPMRLFDLAGKEIPAEQRPTARVLRENRGILGAEYVLERADATRRHVLAYPHPMHGEDGTLTGAVSLMVDVTELRQAQHALLASEVFAQATIDSVSAHICVLDETGKVVAVNLAWREFCLQSHPQPEEATAYVGTNYLKICEAAEGPDTSNASAMATGIRQIMDRTLAEFTLEYPCDSPTEQRWFLARVTHFRDASRNIVVAHEDITERKQAEIGVKRLNRVYAVLSEINSLIVRVRDRDELFRRACLIAVEHGGFHMAMIGIVDRATNKVVPVASAGKEEELLQAVRNVLASDETAPTTMVAKAIRDKTAIVSNDIEDDPRNLLRKNYTRAGVRSLAVLPLMASGTAVGVLALYAREKDFFHEEEMKLLTELADDVAFAIDHIDQKERLDHLASFDPLTGLANRRLFLERLDHCTRGAGDEGHRLALFLIDLERFKNINDTLGQPAGDALLQQVTQWLTRHLGDENRVARVGADQFAIALPEDSDTGHVSRQLEAMIEAFLAHPFELDGDMYRIAAKFGGATFPDDGVDAATLFKNAEAALKKAKAGGYRHLFYTRKMTETVAQRLNLENQMRQALENEEFVLHYQPKVNLGSGEITAVEALIRWNDPHAGLVPPSIFIPILEETGLIYEVGRWALRQSLKDYLRWRAAGLHAVRIAVNVSPLQLRHPGFIALIEQAVAIDAHAAEGLELEITEGMIMGDIKQAIASLHAIRALGISIAIDDFGTGFSSLSYLSKLPIDSLKIDRAFIVGMTEDAQGLSLVSTIINLAHSLQLKVVAEGVETEAQSKLLRLLKCDEMQGFLFSKPVPADVLEEKFLARLLQAQ